MPGPSKKSRFHKLEDVTCSIGPCAGVPAIDLSGYGDGGVTIEPEADLGEFDMGADGLATYVESSNGLVIVTLTLKASAVANNRLYTMARAFQGAQGSPPCPFMLVNPHNGDEISDRWAGFLNIPGMTQEDSAPDREWRLGLPNGRENMVHAPNITV